MSIAEMWSLITMSAVSIGIAVTAVAKNVIKNLYNEKRNYMAAIGISAASAIEKMVKDINAKGKDENKDDI